MDAAGLALGVIAAVVEIYKVVEAAYDLYLEVKDFPSTYQELYVCLQIERHRLELWGSHVLSVHEQEHIKTSPSDLKLWKLFQSILRKILDAFHDATQKMGSHVEQVDMTRREGFAGGPHLIQTFPSKTHF